MPVLRMSARGGDCACRRFRKFLPGPGDPADPFAGRTASDADPVEGEHLYATLGCRTCHILGASGGGYYGPPPDSGKRLKSGWIYKWLKGPQHGGRKCAAPACQTRRPCG